MNNRTIKDVDFNEIGNALESDHEMISFLITIYNQNIISSYIIKIMINGMREIFV